MGAAVRVDLTYVKPERDRQGRTKYYYFRRNGRRWRLPGEPLSAAFMAEYERLKAATEPATQASTATVIPGSLKALAVAYYTSPEFRDLKPGSKRVYRMVIDKLVDGHGHKPVALIERRHVKHWRDARSETPGMANLVVKVARVLLAYAVDENYRKDNPAHRLKLFKLGEHRAWTAEELAAFERRWPAGTTQRRAYVLARYTGQRCGDVAAMTRAHRSAGSIRVKQQKTGKELWIAEHRELAAELARGEQAHMSLLTRASGEGFSGDSLSPWVAEAIEAAGLPEDCVMHGLRKVAARDLAEAGCTEPEIAAITGQSLAEVQRYTRSANQRLLAEAAILKLERNVKRTRSGKRPRGGSGKR